MRLRDLDIPRLWGNDPEVIWRFLRWFLPQTVVWVLAPGSRGYCLDRVPRKRYGAYMAPFSARGCVPR